MLFHIQTAISSTIARNTSLKSKKHIECEYLDSEVLGVTQGGLGVTQGVLGVAQGGLGVAHLKPPIIEISSFGKRGPPVEPLPPLGRRR